MGKAHIMREYVFPAFIITILYSILVHKYYYINAGNMYLNYAIISHNMHFNNDDT